MTLAELYFRQFSTAQYFEFCIRLVVSFVVGGLIGLERSNRFKEAGIRTHILVCLTTTLIMLISKYGFADMSTTAAMEYYGSKGADTARVAAQAVSGISFLCAGVIIKGIGLAIGAGMYVVTGFTVLLLWLLQYVIYRLPFGAETYDGYHLKFVVKGGSDFETILKEQIKRWNAMVTENSISWKRNDTAEFDYVIHRAEVIKYSEIKKFVEENDTILSFSFNPLRAHVH